MKTFQVKDIDLKQDTTFLIASKRNTGKSILAREVVVELLKKYDFHFILMFSKTAHLTGDWEFLDKDLIFNDNLIDEKIEQVFKYQEQKKNTRINKNGKHGLILLDDISINQNKFSEWLSNVFTQGRHFYITIIIIVQYPRHIINPIIRNNIDYLFVNELDFKSIQTIFDIIHTEMTIKQFRNFLNENNNDYKFMFYDNVTQNKQDRIKFVKANILEIKNKK